MALERKAPLSVVVTLIVALVCNIGLWYFSHTVKAAWPGVPPVPSPVGARAMTLGDDQFSYRNLALTLQNLGDVGGDVTPLGEYDYTRLKDWFWLLYALDPVSDHVPMTAAFYFGATRDQADACIVVEYLAEAGYSAIGQKWRWLAQAVFLARHRIKDIDYALELAYKLADIDRDDIPAWTKQMPAFVLTAQGEKQAAKDIMEAILASDKNLHPNEINFMIAYIEDHLQPDSPLPAMGRNDIEGEELEPYTCPR